MPVTFKYAQNVLHEYCKDLVDPKDPYNIGETQINYAVVERLQVIVQRGDASFDPSDDLADCCLNIQFRSEPPQGHTLVGRHNGVRIFYSVHNSLEKITLQ